MAQKYDNVILFGAGASADAGIPLLNNFVDTMWGYAVRGSSPRGSLQGSDRKLLTDAEAIRVGLERYNSRANFNIRNLEDVLSLLSFEALAGGIAVENYQTWKRAITRTIELSTSHPFRDANEAKYERRETVYHQFWHTVLGAELYRRPPALITFNYDLVLERTLWDYFHHLQNDQIKPEKPSCKINYFLRPYDFVIRSEPCQYTIPIPNSRPAMNQRHHGLRPEFKFNCDADVEIPYLKLHGSLNWSGREVEAQNKNPEINYSPTE